MRKRVLLGISVLVALGLAVASPGLAAPPFQHTRSAITYPQDGATLSGVVEIRGIAMHPSAQWWYDVSYSPGPTATGGSQWINLAFEENKPVEDDVLATWDTTTVPDGVYHLALTVKGEGDPQYWQTTVENLTVNNAEAQPTPTSDETTPEDVPTVGAATPTPVTVQQPATSTPRPSPAPGEEGEEATPAAGQQESADVVLDTGMLRSGFCTGVLIVLMLFLLGGLYVFAKALIRWYLRQSARPRLHQE